jgi:hypothetical protein
MLEKQIPTVGVEELTIPFGDVLLRGETDLDAETIERRRAIAEHIIEHPDADEVLSRTLIFQPSVGCLNRCGFCSQGAGNEVRWLSEDSLNDVFGGLQGALRQSETETIGGGREHKTSVIFPYLDNDAGSYPYLDTYVERMGELGSRVRIATVGFSRHNPALQAMHTRIATDLEANVDGARFSWTPYTFAWANGAHRPEVSRDEYVADFGNLLRTYRPLLEAKGPGRETCSVEMRFKPCIETDHNGMRIESKEDGGGILAVGPYTVIAADTSHFADNTRIIGLDRSHPDLSNPGVRSLVLASSELGELTDEMYQEAITILAGNENLGREYQPIQLGGKEVLARLSLTYRFANEDGDYYAVDPFQQASGHFDALHLYPKTDKRPSAGYADSQRSVMNETIDHKQTLGYGPKEEVHEATQDDVNQVLANLKQRAEFYRPFLPHLADHIESEISPMTDGIAEALRQSGLPPSLFFHRHFIIDTGQAVNQGRAYELHFKGIASHRDMPTTPNEIKGYGEGLSLSAVRGNAWAIAFSAAETGTLGRAASGLKQKTGNLLALGRLSGLTFREWDVVTFDNYSPDGKQLRNFFVEVELDTDSAVVRDAPAGLIPGIIPLQMVARPA